jgi:hypothetical protein
MRGYRLDLGSNMAFSTRTHMCIHAAGAVTPRTAEGSFDQISRWREICLDRYIIVFIGLLYGMNVILG